MSKTVLSEGQLREYYEVQKLTQRQIAKKLGVSQTCISYWIRKYGIPESPNKGGAVVTDLSGQRFGRLVVISLDTRAIHNSCRQTLWKCMCDCGTETLVWGQSLTNHLTQSCGCLKHDMMFKGVGELSGCYWHKVEKGARLRKLSMSITIEYGWNLFLQQNKKCALSGLDICIVSNYTRDRRMHTASLDRIDNQKGYDIGNVQWVHRDINRMKWTLKQNYFLSLCKTIAEFQNATT